jgi:hypothetical protein
LLSFALVSLCAPAFAQRGLIISEYVEGSSNNHAIELYNGTRSSINIGNFFLRIYLDGATTPITTVSMAGQVQPGATYVIVHTGSSPAVFAKANLFSADRWFDGNDALVLVDVNGVVIDSFGQVGMNPGSGWGSGATSTLDRTLRRRAAIAQGDTSPSDAFDPSLEWEGFEADDITGLGVHNATPPPPPVVPVAEIFEIQGLGSSSSFAGQKVKTLDNIVTAVLPRGFFIQTPEFRADTNAATSNGLMVVTTSAPAVAVGNQVDVTGIVSELGGMTQLNGDVTFTVDTPVMPVPAHIALAAGFSNFESVEGMLVRLQNGVAAAGTGAVTTKIVAGSARPFRTIGVNGGNYPAIVDVDSTRFGGPIQQIIGGAAISRAEGPLGVSSGRYAIWTTTLQFTNPTLPRAVRARKPGELTVAAQNMRDLFDNRDDPALSEPVAPSAVYNARLNKISIYVRNTLGSPDVLAVSEVESLVALQDVAARINADGAGLNYTAYLREGNDASGIDVGFLMRSSVAVDAISQIGATDTWTAPGATVPERLYEHPPLLLRGAYVANGARFPLAVIAVHQFGRADVTTSARVRAKRSEQATRLAAAVSSMLNADAKLRLVLTGDFEAYEFSDGYVDVMGILTAKLTNRALSVALADRYSVVEEGVAAMLDHSLTSAELSKYVRGVQFARAHADATTSSAPASDRDGVALFIMSDADGDGFPDDGDSCSTGDTRPTVVLGGCDSGVRNLLFEDGCSLTDRIVALRGNGSGNAIPQIQKFLQDLIRKNLLKPGDQGAIVSCLAKWKVGK